MKSAMKMLILLSLGLSFAFVACAPPKMDAESSLRRYIEYRFQEGQKREVLLSFLTGPLYLRMSALSDAEFAEVLKWPQTKIKKLSFRPGKCSDTQCFYIYHLSYSAYQEETEKSLTEVKMMAEMVKEEGQWKVSDLKNIKTFHESLEEIKVGI